MTDVAVIAVEAAHAFRVGREAEGNTLLTSVIDGVLVRAEHPAVRAIEPALGEMLAAQQRGDTLRVADLLEYVVAPACRAMSDAPRRR